MSRDAYVHLYTACSPEEHALVTAWAARQQLTVAELIRQAINAMAGDVGDELVFLEPRKRGRPRKEAA